MRRNFRRRPHARVTLARAWWRPKPRLIRRALPPASARDRWRYGELLRWRRKLTPPAPAEPPVLTWPDWTATSGGVTSITDSRYSTSGRLTGGRYA